METAPPESAKPRFETVNLSTPIVRGETEIASLTLRKPRAGELRGLSLQNILTTEVTALLTLIPRISEPPLTADEADGLDPEDLSEIGGTIRGFFMTKAEREIVETMVAEHRPRT